MQGNTVQRSAAQRDATSRGSRVDRATHDRGQYTSASHRRTGAQARSKTARRSEEEHVAHGRAHVTRHEQEDK